MTILAVDNSAEALASLGERLSHAFPGDFIRLERDPLAAAKYSYTHPVDVLLAAPETRPMNGWKLCEFVRRTNPRAILLMIAETDALDCLCADPADGLLPQRTSADDLRRAVCNARQGGRADGSTALWGPTASNQ